MSQKKIALINDFTGFGRCAIGVQLPVMSKLKIQCCLAPTAVLSNHSAYPEWYMDDYTDRFAQYVSVWDRLGISFDGIVTGFMCSSAQIEETVRFVEKYKNKNENILVVTDPVMGDNGRIYGSYNEEACALMKELVSRADVITPNVTECCILTDTAYKTDFSMAELEKMAEKLCCYGPGRIVITGIETESCIGNYCYELGGYKGMVRVKKAKTKRCGTGDIFTAIIAAKLINGSELKSAVRSAARFIKLCIEVSDKIGVPQKEGVAFEEVLDKLK